MRPKKYYQLIEKDDAHISGVWKVFHVFCFIGIAISSTVGARAFCEIFDIFNYRCVLYAKVSTKLSDIKYKNESTSSTEEYENEIENFIEEPKPMDESKIRNLFGLKLNLGIFDEDYNMEFGRKHRTLDFVKAEPVPGVPNMYIYDDELWLSNKTMIARVHLVMTRTVFATEMMCNFTIFVPFISLIVSATFALIVILFSRSHRTVDSIPPAWFYVYPLIITTGTMAILTVVTFNLVYNGFNAFCARFIHLTGQKQCTHLMDYFTKEQKLGRRDLYWNIKMSQLTFFLSTIFWFVQLFIIVIRILITADFDFTKVLIRKKTRYDDYDYDADDYFDLGGYEFDNSSQAQFLNVIKQVKQRPRKEEEEEEEEEEQVKRQANENEITKKPKYKQWY